MEVSAFRGESRHRGRMRGAFGAGRLFGASLIPLLSELPVPVCVTRAEADGRILFANHAAAALAGLPLEDLLDLDPVELYADPADRVRLLEELRRDGTAVDAELRFRTADGRLLWVLLSARLIVVDGERLLVATVQDIDERHRAEQRVAALLRRIEEQNAELEARVAERTRELAQAHDAAARSQAQLIDAIEAMSDGFALWDEEDRFVLCNSKYRDEHSLAAEHLIPGMSHRQALEVGVARGLVPRGYGSASWIRERMARHRQPGKPCVVRYRDGRSVRMSEHRTREGGTVSIRTDITELVRRTEALERSERLLQGVIDAVPATISVKDRQSRYVLINRYHGETYGSPEATIGKTSFDLVGGRYGEPARERDLLVIESGAALPFTEREFVDVAGTPRTWFTAKVPLANARGEVDHVVTVGLDITRLKATERARANLSRYFAPNMVELLAASDEPFGPARHQDIALLFVDIVGFTRICTQAPVETVFELLREFLKRMAACVFDCAGTLDKYTGDGMLATFGTPEPGERDATRALRCAHAMRREMAAWNATLRAAGRAPIRIAIGAHCGPALLGNLGSERRLDFGVVGDTANVANRLEKLARPLRAELVVSEALVDRVRQESGDDAAELAGLVRLGPKRVRGRNAPVTVWASAP